VTRPGGSRAGHRIAEDVDRLAYPRREIITDLSGLLDVAEYVDLGAVAHPDTFFYLAEID
jgi:hypothetical protein